MRNKKGIFSDVTGWIIAIAFLLIIIFSLFGGSGVYSKVKAAADSFSDSIMNTLKKDATKVTSSDAESQAITKSLYTSIVSVLKTDYLGQDCMVNYIQAYDEKLTDIGSFKIILNQSEGSKDISIQIVSPVPQGVPGSDGTKLTIGSEKDNIPNRKLCVIAGGPIATNFADFILLGDKAVPKEPYVLEVKEILITGNYFKIKPTSDSAKKVEAVLDDEGYLGSSRWGMIDTYDFDRYDVGLMFAKDPNNICLIAAEKGSESDCTDSENTLDVEADIEDSCLKCFKGMGEKSFCDDTVKGYKTHEFCKIANK